MSKPKEKWRGLIYYQDIPWWKDPACWWAAGITGAAVLFSIGVAVVAVRFGGGV